MVNARHYGNSYHSKEQQEIGSFFHGHSFSEEFIHKR